MLNRRGDAGGWASRLRSLARLVVGAIVALAVSIPGPAMARRWQRAAGEAAAGPIFEWIMLDAETGQVLGEQNADAVTYPASLTKMMTLFLTFEQLNLGHVTLDRQFIVSPYAASRAPSRLGLAPGEGVAVRDLILGIVTKSANDAATVLAEGLAGSEANFARYMTWKARQLGMDHTWYVNASGLPNPEQRTTARDIARLALALYQHFPREYRYFATREFDFHGQIVHGHDHLLDWYPGADGIKTGFINASGFNLATSAVRNGHRLIGVVMGGRSARVRDMQMASLLDQGFAILASGRPAQPGGETLVAAASAQPPFPAPPQTAPPPFPPPPVVVAAARASAPIAMAATAAPTVPTRAPVAARAAVAPAVERIAAAPERSTRVLDESESTEAKPGFLGKFAHAALRHLEPVANAEASTLAHTGREGRDRSDDWAIQIGAFRAVGAAEHAAREAALLAVARGKPRQVLAPARAERPALYRARLLHFTERAAHTACSELRRRGVACSVVRAAGVRVASG